MKAPENWSDYMTTNGAAVNPIVHHLLTICSETADMIRYLAPLSVLTLLAACNAPPPGFYGVDATSIDVGGTTFDVRVKGEDAILVRTSKAFAPTFDGVSPAARTALSRVTSCEVGTLSGDASLLRAKLDCPDM